MNYEKEVISNWEEAVFYFTHNFLSYEAEISEGLKSKSSEVRCASIAILNQCNSVTCPEEIYFLLNDDSNDVIKFSLEYLSEFGEMKHANKILEFIEVFPFLASSALSNIRPNICAILNDDDTKQEKAKVKECWQLALNNSGD